VSIERIPDLWPESLRVDVLTPYAVISAQATKLKERTQGLVEGLVSSRAVPPGLICHTFDLFAPVLSFRYTLFRLWHQESMPYPVALWASQESPSTPPADIARALSDIRSSVASDVVLDEEALIIRLRNEFEHPTTRTVIGSLIARSNEFRTGSAPEVEIETPGTDEGSTEAQSLAPNDPEE
jgi:hypothetical protein